MVSEGETHSNPYDAANVERTHTSPVVRLARRLGMDRAIGFAVLARFWQLLTGPLTQLLIVFCLSEVEQGYYYAFMNLLAMQVFVELGLHVVLINVASHEWSGLQLTANGPAGDECRLSRLVSLGRTAVCWYTVAGLVFVAGVTIAGSMFFSDLTDASGQPYAGIAWLAPWCTLVLLTGLQLIILPLTAILEGCDQLRVVNRVRFWQAIIGSLAVWAAMWWGLGLWALCASAAVRLLGEVCLVAVCFRHFFRPFRRAPAADRVDWFREILPLQWRMAVQGALLWFANHLALLVVLKYHGAEAAGRYGMMATVLVALQAASLSWIETRRPVFGQLIAERRWEELDETFFRMSRISISLLAIGGSLFTLGVWIVGLLPGWFFERIAARLPGVLPTLLLSAALIVMQLAQCTNIYVRAHKRDPFLLAAVVSNLTIAALVFLLGREYGAVGVAGGYLLGVCLVQVPWWVAIWSRTRRNWHTVEGTT